MNYWVIFEKTGTGYSAWIPDVPGCVAAAKTLEETKTMMQEALTGHFEVMREFGETIPVPSTVAACIAIEVPAEALTPAA